MAVHTKGGRTHDEIIELGGTMARADLLREVDDHCFVWLPVRTLVGGPDASFLIVKAGIVTTFSGDAAGVLEIEIGRAA